MDHHTPQRKQARANPVVHTGPFEWLSKWKWEIAGLGIALLILLVAGGAGLTAIFLTYLHTAQVVDLPEVVLNSPADGSQVQLHRPVTVRATVINVETVHRLEFWVDGPQGSQLQEAKEVSSQNQTSLTALFQWNPNHLGAHTLEIKAYDTTGRVRVSAVALVEVIENPPPPVLPETFPPDRTPLVAKTNLTVRAGPGETYEAIAVLVAGTRIMEMGRSENQQWRQILFDESNGGVGWIPADPDLVTTTDTAPVAGQVSAPLPTATITPTNTPAPADTPTPTPTPTNTPAPTAIPPAQAPAMNQSPPGEGPPGQDRQGAVPDLAAAAEELGVTEEALRDALGDPPPDFEAAAEALGVTEEALQNALGAPPDGGRP